MLTLLPSIGATGIKSVDLVLPTYNVIKQLLNINEVEFHIKNKFIEPLINCDINKITIWDRDYVYLILVSSMRDNKLKYDNLVCPYCQFVHSYTLKIKECDVYDLPEGTELKTNLEIDGKNWWFKLPQVIDEEESLVICEELIGEFNQLIFDNLMLSKVLSGDTWKPNYTTEESFIESIKELPTNVYKLAHSFINLSFHGISPISNIECPNCKKNRNIQLNVKGSSVKFPIETLMRLYASVSSVVSYTEFLAMTAQERNSLIQALSRS